MSHQSEKSEGKSLPWFRVDVSFVDHPKTHALEAELAREVKKTDMVARGHADRAGWYLIRLWAYTMRFFPDGVVARAGRADGAETALERACEWRGEPGVLYRALVTTGWLVTGATFGVRVNDWDDYQGAAVAKAEKDAERKRLAREQRAGGAETARAVPAAGAGNGTERNGTERNKEEDQQPPTFEIVSPLAALKEAPEEEIDAAIEAFDARAFWQWAESIRRGYGWAPERWPNPLALKRWWVEARDGARPVKQLLDAWINFARDDHWRAAKPPAPFAAFMKGWNKYLSRVTR